MGRARSSGKVPRGAKIRVPRPPCAREARGLRSPSGGGRHGGVPEAHVDVDARALEEGQQLDPHAFVVLAGGDVAQACADRVDDAGIGDVAYREASA
jgi:hypothetical protein